MVFDDSILPWLACMRAEVPGIELFDAHTHLGRDDPDGYRCTPDELLRALDEADGRAAVFAMHEPMGYPDANDRVIEAAARSDGRLSAFCRVDPADSPAAEARRCVAAGARGIKLHPRAEGFALDHPALEDVYAFAGERELTVLTHAGRGIPALGRHALEACERHPGMRLILAHAGISDLAWIWREAEAHPNLFFDTAWWSASDLLTLFALVPPGQILFASDAPYGSPAWAAAMALRFALQAGLEPDQVRSVMGAQMARLVAGEAPLDLGPPPGPGSIAPDPLLDRVHTFLASALGRMLGAGADASESLALAALACEVGDDAPQAPVCRAILALLERQASYVPVEGERPARFGPGLHLVVFAAALARTPLAPLPDAVATGDVAERERGEFPKHTPG